MFSSKIHPIPCKYDNLSYIYEKSLLIYCRNFINYYNRFVANFLEANEKNRKQILLHNNKDKKKSF